MSSPLDELAVRDSLNLVIEKLQAGRCAFYVLDRPGSFRLAAGFGFGRTERPAVELARTDPLVEFVFERREPAFINDIRTAGRLRPILEAAAAARLLAAPLFLNGRITGILEVRDKKNGEPFTSSDIPWVLEALRRISVSMRTQEKTPAADSTGQAVDYSVFEQTVTLTRPQLSSPSGRGPEFEIVQGAAAYDVLQAEKGAQGRPVVPLAVPIAAPPEAFPSNTERLIQLIEERMLVGEGRGADSAAGGSVRESSFYRFFTEAFVSLPEVEAVALSVYEPGQLTVWLACRRMFSPEAEAVFFDNLDKTLQKQAPRFGLPGARTINPVFVSPRGEESASAPLGKSEVGAIQSSLVTAGSGEVTLFSLVFRRSATPADRDAAKPVHVLVKNALVEVRAAVRYRESYRGLVSLFLEPGLKRFTALKTHSLSVGRMARKFATHLGLPSTEIEQLTVAGILHDVGMRELNYDEIYAKRTLSESEIRLVRQHPRLGAYLLEAVPWPYPVAPLVKHHHERWDGGGYPDGLRAEEIPLGSRIIHLCETFDAMTSSSSYRQVYNIDQALEIISKKRGTQFDPDLTPAFLQLAENLGT